LTERKPPPIGVVSGPFQRQAGAADAVERRLGQRVAAGGDCAQPTLLDVPDKRFAQRLEHRDHRFDDLGADPVAWDQRRLDPIAAHRHWSLLATTGLATTGLANTGLASAGPADAGPADAGPTCAAPVGTAAPNAAVPGGLPRWRFGSELDFEFLDLLRLLLRRGDPFCHVGPGHDMIAVGPQAASNRTS
jgi:hypothetical protein